MRPAPSRGNYWKGIVSATASERPPVTKIATGVIAKVLPKLDSSLTSLPLAVALNTGWRFIQTASTKGTRNAALEMGISLASEAEYDAASDLLWRTVAVSSGLTAYSQIAQFAEIAFKRVLNRILFSIEKRGDKEVTTALSNYLREKGAQGFVRDTLAEYLSELTLSFLRSDDKELDLNGSFAFHRKGDKWRSHSDEEEFRRALKDTCSRLADEASAYLTDSNFFKLLGSEPSDEVRQNLETRLTEILRKKMANSRVL